MPSKPNPNILNQAAVVAKEWREMFSDAGKILPTFVVDAGGMGDYTTIQGAVDALFDDGGVIVVKPGTYNITSTITLPDKPVKIVGSGIGVTVIDLGTSVIAAFTVPDTLTAKHLYDISHLKINGGNVIGQEAVRIASSGSYGDVYLSHVRVDNVETVINVTNGDATWTNTTLIRMNECFLEGADAPATFRYLKCFKSSAQYYSGLVVEMYRVQSSIFGARTYSAQFDVDCDFEFTDCYLRLGNYSGDYGVNSWYQLRGSIFMWNADIAGRKLYSDGTFSAINTNIYGPYDYSVPANSKYFTVECAYMLMLVNCDCAYMAFHGIDRGTVTGCYFKYGIAAASAPAVFDLSRSIGGGQLSWTFSGNIFYSSNPTAHILVGANMNVMISNCYSWGTPGSFVTEAASSSTTIISGCRATTGTVLLSSTSRVDGRFAGGAPDLIEGIGKANINSTAVGNVGGGEDNLITYTLPAKALLKTNSAVRITAWGTTVNNVNAKTLKLYFGATAILTYSLTTSQAGLWRIDALVIKTGASTQDTHARLTEAPNDQVHQQVSTAAITDTSTIVIKCTGEGVSNNDIVQEGMLVELLN